MKSHSFDKKEGFDPPCTSTPTWDPSRVIEGLDPFPPCLPPVGPGPIQPGQVPGFDPPEPKAADPQTEKD